MSLAEQVQLERAEEQMREPIEVRQVCKCGCGRWWYRTAHVGRPQEFATRTCYWRWRNRRRRKVVE